MTLPQQPNEVLIDGVLYDVANFKHPGGSVIKFLAGKGDATEAFCEFHERTQPKVAKYLKSLPQRPAPAGSHVLAGTDLGRAEKMARFTKEYKAWRKQLVLEGWFEPSYSHTFYRLAELVVMHVVGLYLMLSTPYWIPGLFILGIAQGRCGWLMHEGGHGSMTGVMWLDRRLQEFLYAAGCGMSGAWWRIQHNKHHCAPQKLHHDVDLDTLPFVAFNEAIARAGRKNPLAHIFVPIQAYIFSPIICTLVTLQWQFFVHPRHMWRTKRGAEFFWLVVRYAAVYQLFLTAGLTLGQSVMIYLLYDLVGGTYIFTNFALSHTHLPVTEKDVQSHWLEFAATYTINITPHWFTNWWMGYLNFQIEHHLFPTMPQYKFVRLSPHTRKFFAKCGIQYDCRDYFDAVRTTFGNLQKVGHAI